jgi:lysyl-tRNA synthetase class 2
MTAEIGNEYVEQRRANMKALAEKGYPSFGKAFKRSGRLAEIRSAFEENKAVSAAGRLTTNRDMGKSIFADLRDGSDRFQIYAQKSSLGDAAFEAFKLLDLGDHVGVEGTLFTTRTGEQTLKIERWTLLSKALLPLPEKWHGLKDTDQRYRQRYLDLISNPGVREVFNKRIQTVREIRNYLVERQFQEVETPMMQSQPGGATARPFVTHYEALNSRMYLRIAPELYLKRLLVGGFDKVFELNRNFRNEGLSRTHNPEFTMMEVYEAYSDRRGMQELVEGLITHVAQVVMGTLKVGTPEAPIDLTSPWREVTYRDLVLERMGADWFSLEKDAMRAKAEAAGLHGDPAWSKDEITHEIYSKLIEKTLQNPTFVTRLPAELVPLAKRCEDDPTVVDVFELVIGGKEIAPGYSELNDPQEQRKRLEEQVALAAPGRAAEEAQKVDEDFLAALEHGMPPAGGMGIGIDRLIMTLTGSEAIRDVILFPQLKPRDLTPDPLTPLTP